jgi:hypothetical protein
MKTSLQTAIEFYKSKLAEYPKKYNISQVDIAVHKSYCDIIKYLDSLLEKEKQDLIEAYLEGQKECSNEFAMGSDASFYFKKTFQQSN